MSVEAIANPAEIMLALDDFWNGSPRSRYQNEPLTRLSDSRFAQRADVGNPYWEIARRLPLDAYTHYKVSHGHAVELDGFVQRHDYTTDYIVSRPRLVKTFAWSIPTPGDVEWIATVLDGRSVVEIGAGTGYWASQMLRAGVDVLAFDREPGGNEYCAEVQYHPTLQGGPESAAEYPDRALMLCWPPYGTAMARDALAGYAGDLVIYVGEPEYGCTADDDFFTALEREWESVGSSPHHVTFSGIHCYVEAYRRKAVAS